ncbi:hypothetical protein BKK52_01120 [Rodentibacter trehalosifermentans]|uniref:Uncharacterized protein n=1 Tax=Rodentibacter trehalosifermentans TaxID=1908263 RepID=A0A1V3J779_9PAST|nr:MULTISPECIES: hypothetical protein [Rodentibacter]OOF50779.1 hypothetical protein BKK52_01120 [Rodentibacter trehalosifermentans]QIA76799.1 hypothetical protein FEE42_05230 [Rodentibacter heylii]
MCQKNYHLELGKTVISRRILAELTVEQINRFISYHQCGYVMLGSGEWVQTPCDPNAQVIVSFYQVGNDTVVIGTDLASKNYRTEVFFFDESDDLQKGYFDWALYQSRKTPFTLGRVVCTAEVKKSLGMQHIHRLIEKQLSYDWGIIYRSAWAHNDQAVENGGRVLSHHYIGDEYVYVLTEADRSSTTIMLEYEY